MASLIPFFSVPLRNFGEIIIISIRKKLISLLFQISSIRNTCISLKFLCYSKYQVYEIRIYHSQTVEQTYKDVWNFLSHIQLRNVDLAWDLLRRIWAVECKQMKRILRNWLQYKCARIGKWPHHGRHGIYKLSSNLTYRIFHEAKHAYIIVIRCPNFGWVRPLEMTSCCSEKENKIHCIGCNLVDLKASTFFGWMFRFKDPSETILVSLELFFGNSVS